MRLRLEEVTTVERPVAAEGPIEPDSTPSREVRHEYALNLPRILEHLRSSLLVSTYQAGKVVVVGAGAQGLELSYHNFEKATGIAVRPRAVAVGAQATIWHLRDDPNLARQIEPFVFLAGTCQSIGVCHVAFRTDRSPVVRHL